MKQTLSLGFIHILLGEYLLKQKLVVVKPPKWKSMAIIARNAISKGHQGQIFVRFGSTMVKKTD